jgi:hypothetical protein
MGPAGSACGSYLIGLAINRAYFTRQCPAGYRGFERVKETQPVLQQSVANWTATQVGNSSDPTQLAVYLQPSFDRKPNRPALPVPPLHNTSLYRLWLCRATGLIACDLDGVKERMAEGKHLGNADPWKGEKKILIQLAGASARCGEVHTERKSAATRNARPMLNVSAAVPWVSEWVGRRFRATDAEH